MKKKVIISLIAFFYVGTQVIPYAGNNSNYKTSTALEYKTQIPLAEDLTDYINNQVFVMYTNGDYEVKTYGNSNELFSAIMNLQRNVEVAYVQPNYEYAKTSLSVNDKYVPLQWALYNDGSFVMKEDENGFPVFDNPFKEPSQPSHRNSPTSSNGNIIGKSISTKYATSKSTSGVDINVEEAWNIYKGGREVVVALVDTGIDYTHQELRDILWANKDEIANNGKDDDSNGYIDDVSGWNFYNNNNKIYVGSEDNHGTHCAGTIAANRNNSIGISGIANSNDIKIMSVKALGGKDGGGYTDTVIKAIKYAEDNGASICNLSLGFTRNDKALYQTIANSDMLFVVAAGNGDNKTGYGVDTDTTPIYPSAYKLENIISVANLQSDGTLNYNSNYGKTSVDLAAPGTYILGPTTNNTYSFMTGTSMAAPMVTATAAIVYSYFDNISLADTKNILLDTVTPLDSLNGIVATGGMLNIGSALKYDLKNLRHDKWHYSDNDTTNYIGNPPVFSFKTTTSYGKEYLVVTVTDDDNDIASFRYSKGTCSASAFEMGTKGMPLTLNSDNTITFTVSRGGTYTFYALDYAGNEVVSTITLTTPPPNINVR